MGLLDDAIREHLDLKRRRGADPSEIERAEREALGPVRRGPEDVEPGLEGDLPSEHMTGADEPLAYGETAEDSWSETFDDETELFGAERPQDFGDIPPAPTPEGYGSEEEHSPEPRSAPVDLPPEDEMATRQYSAIPEPHPAESSEPEPPVEAPEPDAASPSPSHGEETVEYDVEGQDPDTRGDDVLEETPEFLQDTPDHDRLWFEQRPPRDFDFEG